MPTSADLLLDTSAAVALCLGSTPDRAAVVERTTRSMLGLAGHAAFETYSVLTRLPGDQRLSDAMALRMIDQNFPATHHIAANEAALALVKFSRLGIKGGSVYDGLVAWAARSAGTLLLTRDRRAVQTYALLDVGFELV